MAKGLVFAGNAGGDNKGVKGRMYALYATTGAIVCEHYLCAARSAKHPSRPGRTGASDDRRRLGQRRRHPPTGGATSTAYLLDAATGTLYVPGGNPAPDFAPHLQPGGNLFAGSVIALDAKTRAVKAVYPLVERDFHDWDVSAAPSIITTRAGRRIAASPIKDGHLHLIDPAVGKVIHKTRITTVSNADVPLTAGRAVRFCPGTQGGAEWNGAA